MLELHSDASSLGLHCGGDASFGASVLGMSSCVVFFIVAKLRGLECGGNASFGASVLGMSSCVVAWADAEAMLA